MHCIVMIFSVSYPVEFKEFVNRGIISEHGNEKSQVKKKTNKLRSRINLLIIRLMVKLESQVILIWKGARASSRIHFPI